MTRARLGSGADARPARAPRAIFPFLALALVVAARAAHAGVAYTPGVPALVVDGGTSFRMSGATRLTTPIDVHNFGAFIPAAGSAVIVNGYGMPLLLGVSYFADLTVNLSGIASLGNGATVNGVLTLTRGLLGLANADLVANTISGGSAASYVMTPDTLGRLARTAFNAGATAFPVGNSSYDPVAITTGLGADVFRVAVTDAPPTAGLTAAVALTRAWAIGQSNPPGSNGTLNYTVQWNAPEQGASFDRSIGNTTSAWAWRFVSGAWAPQQGVRVADNGAYPAVDQFVTPNTGLWTLAGLGALLGVGPPARPGVPRGVELAQGAPNPFERETLIRYGLPRSGPVSLALYSLLGERVTTLAQGMQEAGFHVATLDGAKLPGGVYFCRLEADGTILSRKMIVLR